MRQPFRRFMFVLAEKLNMTVKEVSSRMDSVELSEWMAFMLTNDEKWHDKYKNEIGLQYSRESGDETRSRQLRGMFGVK